MDRHRRPLGLAPPTSWGRPADPFGSPSSHLDHPLDRPQVPSDRPLDCPTGAFGSPRSPLDRPLDRPAGAQLKAPDAKRWQSELQIHGVTPKELKWPGGLDSPGAMHKTNGTPPYARRLFNASFWRWIPPALENASGFEMLWSTNKHNNCPSQKTQLPALHFIWTPLALKLITFGVEPLALGTLKMCTAGVGMLPTLISAVEFLAKAVFVAESARCSMTVWQVAAGADSRGKSWILN